MADYIPQPVTDYVPTTGSRSLATPRREVVAVGLRYTGGYTTSDTVGLAGVTAYNYWYPITFTSDCADVSFVWSGGYRYIANPNAYTVRAAVRFPSATNTTGTKVPLYFAGNRDVVVNPGQVVESDPLYGYDFAAGDTADVFVYGTVPTGGAWPVEYFSVWRNSSATDLTLTTWDASVSGQGGFAPAACLGVPSLPGTVPLVCLYGDSVMAGSGEVTGEFRGFGVRAMGSRPWLRFSASGELARYAVGDRRRQVFAGLAKYAVSHHGTNDVNGDRSLVQIQADLQTLWQAWHRRGCRVIACTVTPKTTSTDGWKTTTNQTPASAAFTAGGVRTQLNDWIRTKPAPLWDVLDVCTACESSTDSGLWAVGSEADSGTATSATSTTISDTGKSWTANQWTGYRVAWYSGATYRGSLQIAGNTNTRLTIDGAGSPMPAAGDTYRVYGTTTQDGTHPSGVGHAAMAAVTLQSAGVTLANLAWY